MIRPGGIYSITNIINGKREIGSTIQEFKTRWFQHRYELRNNIHCNPHLQASWNKYGEENFKFEIIQKNIWETEEQLRNIETLYINLYKSYDCRFGYNMSQVACSPMTGRKHSEETKKRLSEIGKGKKRSSETKDRIRKANLGKKLSKETKEKISKTRKERLASGKIIPCGKNKPRTKETKEKISLANKGKKHTKEQNASKSKRVAGKKNPFYGKHHSKKTKEQLGEKISKASKGKPKSKEHRENISKGLKGKPKSKEHKEKLSLARRKRLSN